MEVNNRQSMAGSPTCLWRSVADDGGVGREVDRLAGPPSPSAGSCSYAPVMVDPTLILTMGAPAGDDPYFAEISFEAPGVSCVWAEVVLENVDISAAGADRVANARVVVRAYSDNHGTRVHS